MGAAAQLKKKGSPCLTSLFSPNIYTVVLPYLLRQKFVRKQPISPKGCRQSSGSRCQTSYHSDRSTGSLVQDLPYRGKSNTLGMFLLLHWCPFLDSSVMGRFWKTEIAIKFCRQESRRRICNCINITLYCNLAASDGSTQTAFPHSWMIPNVVPDLRFMNCCSSWEVMLTR